MSEAREGHVPAEPLWRAEPHRWAGRKWMHVEPPPLGAEVGGYRLEVRLGEGGQGSVYRARRGGRLYAIKFLSLASPDWAWRELEVRLRLRRVGGWVVEGHGLWPNEAPCYLYLVTPYVHGRPLDAWARWKNPTAREVARLVLEVARQLVEVHRAGVVHRDVKCANVLVRSEGGTPVLVDFGVSTYVGAPEITHPLAMPGTRYYRSPEALRFRRERAGDHSPARATDDLWALGVVLYWLLTGGYPFDTEVADEGVLADLILKHEPEPPHVLNPRVPRALSELCLRMLEKRPEARFRNAKALCEALEAVLAEAEAEASWDVALCEAWGPDGATTPQEEALELGGWREKVRRLMAYALRHSRRGRPMPLDEASTLARTPGAAPPGEDRAPAGESPAPPPPRTRTLPWRALAWAALALGVVGLLVFPRCPSGFSPEGGSSVTSEVVSRPTMPEVIKSGQEVASPAKPPEGGWGAAPPRASTPAPVATATPRKDGTRVKTPEQAPTHRQENQRRKLRTVLGTAGQACVLVWVAGQFACASPEVQVLPPAPTAPLTPMDRLPPVRCPAYSEETMKELGLSMTARDWAAFFINGEIILHDIITVHPGQQFALSKIDSFGRLPAFTLYIGDLVFGEGRVYGHITQVRTPQGQTYAVCFEMYEGTKPEEHGVEMKPGSGPGTAKIFSHVWIRAVRRFED